MKTMKWIWSALCLTGRCAWELLTLAAPKSDDSDCGVCLTGQGR